MQGTTAVGLPNGNVRESLMGQSLLGLQAALPILLICWLVAASKVLVTWAVLMGCWGRIYILPVSWLVKNRWTQAAAAKSSGSSDPDGLTYIRPWIAAWLVEARREGQWCSGAYRSQASGGG